MCSVYGLTRGENSLSKVAEVAEMLSVYIRRASIDGADELGEISGRLCLATTADEVGGVAELLHTFTALTLQQHSSRGDS